MWRLTAFLLIILLGFGIGSTGGIANFMAASAQDATAAPDYEQWEKVATRAEVATKDGRASNAALEGLRAELVDWRAQFSAAQGTNSARITTLKNQIESLGPVAEAEAGEPVELTARRSELSAQLSTLEAPQRQAVEAFSRADGLIREIDSITRSRQTERLFELQASPINPALWAGAFRAVSASIVGTRTEIVTAWNSPSLQKRFSDNLVETLIFLLVAFVLLFRGRVWMVRLTARVQRNATGANARLRGFLVSLGQIVLPVLGIFALAEALFSTEMLGLRGEVLAHGVLGIGLAFFGARWLSLRLLPRLTPASAVIQVPQDAARVLRRQGVGLAVLWGIQMLLLDLATLESYAQTTSVVLHFPIILVSGILLFRFGRVLYQTFGASDATAPANHGFRARGCEVLGRILVAVGIVGPVAAVIGFSTAAAAVVFPIILTIGLLALLIILSDLIRDIYGVLTGSDDETAQAALMPVLTGFVIVIGAIPVLALIWGARTSDLAEIWAKFRAGYQLGDATISPTDFLTFIVVFAIGYMLTRAVQTTLKTSVLPKTNIDPGGQSAIVSGLGYVGIFLAAVIAISTAGIDLSSLAIVAGALSLGIGFGLQNIVSNFVAGVILLIERPIAEGDWIEVGGYSGTVREISVRSTRIETFDRTDVIIPNSDLVSGAVTNYTHGNLIGRAVISVGVAYGTDTMRVQELLLEIARAHPLVSLQSEPSVHMIGFGADSLDFQIRAVLRDVNFILTVKSDIYHEIARRFAEESIEIPFAQRDLWLRNPEVLQMPAKRKPAAKPK